jgi:hypothetical protein
VAWRNIGGCRVRVNSEGLSTPTTRPARRAPLVTIAQLFEARSWQTHRLSQRVLIIRSGRTADQYGELTMAVRALATLVGPGRVWLIQPPAGVHQLLPI